MEYSNVAIIGASATQLSKLDTIQNVAPACFIHFLFLFIVIVMLMRLDCC